MQSVFMAVFVSELVSSNCFLKNTKLDETTKKLKAAEEPLPMFAALNTSQGADLARGLSPSCELLKFSTEVFVLMALCIYFVFKDMKVHSAGRKAVSI